MNWILAGCCVLAAICAQTVHAEITLKGGPPAGFENLSAPQRTAADVYYGGQFLTTAYVEFDPTTVHIEDVSSVIEMIPNVASSARIAGFLSGRQPNHAAATCNAYRRENCGRLEPEVAAVMFDESRFRLDIFINPNELLLHKIERDRYLPIPTVGTSLLHNVRISAAGSSRDKRYTVGAESFLTHDQSRLRARHSLTETGFTLRELSWQRDDRDLEYEVGSFESFGRNLSVISNIDVVGMRVASSTKTRVDLDDALASPVLLFLPERSRVDVFRGDELLDSRYYDAGNQQIDTAKFPDGAYPLTIRTVNNDGTETTQTHFFVRSSLMPPMGEPQFHVEVGALAEPQEGFWPRAGSGRWVRAGMSHRLLQHLGMDIEIIHANGESFIQSGVLMLKPRWHIQATALASNLGTYSYAVNSGYRQGDVGFFLDLRQVNTRTRELAYSDFALFRQGYRNGTATVSFPLWRGRAFLRARINEKSNLKDNGVGFSYWGKLLEHRRFNIDLTLDTYVSSTERWVRAGFNFNWRTGSRYASMKPQALWRDDDFGRDLSGSFDGRWQGESVLPGVGPVQQSLFAAHDQDRKMLGARIVPRANQYSNYELRYESDRNRSDVYYAVNNSFSIATSGGRTTFGDGGQSVGAVVVNIVGNVDGQFEVLVDNRVVGRVWAGRPNVISLRPYASYEVKIRPLGDAIVGFDQRTKVVTLYPGNVENLTFAARELTVVISQALTPQGTPVPPSRFLNVEGYGSTDEGGWFQVEIGHRDPLLLEASSSDGIGSRCLITLPEFNADQGLAVLEPLVCEPTQE